MVPEAPAVAEMLIQPAGFGRVDFGTAVPEAPAVAEILLSRLVLAGLILGRLILGRLILAARWGADRKQRQER